MPQLDPERSATDSPWWRIKSRANEHCVSEPSTAGCSRVRTNEPLVSRPGKFIREERIQIVFRRDEGCSQQLTCATLAFTTWSCMLLRRDRAAVIHVERQVFLPEERVGLCTKGLVMCDFAMECHGNSFRTSDHSMASLAPLKVTLFDPARMQPPDNTRRVYNRLLEDIKRYECEGDNDKCGVDGPTLSTS